MGDAWISGSVKHYFSFCCQYKDTKHNPIPPLLYLVNIFLMIQDTLLIFKLLSAVDFLSYVEKRNLG
jgi:hypothetical protein